MSRKPKNTEEPFSPEQLEKLENKGDKQVATQRQKEGIFQRFLTLSGTLRILLSK